jgi:UDP-glucuronate 4-epimerase
MKILITGVAGFIGFSLAQNLLKTNKKLDVFGIDNLDNYYSKKIKKLRIKELKNFRKFRFINLDITRRAKVFKFFKNKKFKYIIHFAAQVGSSFSQIQPKKYLDTNIFGFINLADACVIRNPNVFAYASSSSVYEEYNNLKPLNVYSATKKINEVIAKFYSNYHKIKFIGLRYSSVYGEWGRPDTFLFKLFRAFHKKFLFLDNFGNNKKNLIYIDDAIILTKKIIFNRNFKERNLVFDICAKKTIIIKNIINFFQKKIGNVKVRNAKTIEYKSRYAHKKKNYIKLFSNYNNFTNYKNGILKTYDWYKKNKIYNL